MGTSKTLAIAGAALLVSGLVYASPTFAAPELETPGPHQSAIVSSASLFLPSALPGTASGSAATDAALQFRLPRQQTVVGTISSMKGSGLVLQTQNGERYSVDTTWGRILIGNQTKTFADLHKGDLILVRGFVYQQAIYADLVVQLRSAPIVIPPSEQFSGLVLGISGNNFVLDTGGLIDINKPPHLPNSPRLLLIGTDVSTIYTRSNGLPGNKSDLVPYVTVNVKGWLDRTQGVVTAQSITILTPSPVPPTTTPTSTPTTPPTSTPTPLPVPTSTPTSTPTPTPTSTPAPIPTSTPTSTPVPLPTSTPPGPATTTPSPTTGSTTPTSTSPVPLPTPTSTPTSPTTTSPDSTTTPPTSPIPAPGPTTTPVTPTETSTTPLPSSPKLDLDTTTPLPLLPETGAATTV